MQKPHNMKKVFTLIAAVVFLYSCSKPDAATVTPEPPINEEKPSKSPILGGWHYKDYSYRYFTIDSVTTNHAYITFGFTIDAPNNKPVRLKYDLQQRGDTLFCTTTTIYPCMYFTSNQSIGWGIEYSNVPQKGLYLPLTRSL